MVFTLQEILKEKMYEFYDGGDDTHNLPNDHFED